MSRSFIEETDLGGARQDFPTTLWTQWTLETVDGEKSRSILSHLAATYWKPIYAYIRTRWPKSNEEAKDLTQDFFVWMQEKRFLERVDRSRGRFRVYLKLSLDHYLADSDRIRRAAKRGGGKPILTLVEDPGAAEWLEGKGLAPEDVLDQCWRNQVMIDAIARLETSLRSDAKEKYFAAFRDFYLTPEDPSYQEVSGRLGITPSDVSNYLMEAKRRFRFILQELVAETVDSPGELESELKWILEKD